MTDIKEIINGLGIKPRSNGSRPRLQRGRLRPAVEPQQAPATSAKPASTRRVFPNAITTEQAATAQAEHLQQMVAEVENGGGGPFGVGNFFKKGASELLEKVDLGRSAVVSGVKEASDYLTYDTPVGDFVQSARDALDELPGMPAQDPEQNVENNNEHGSLSELASQTKRHIGFQEVLDKNTSMPGGWQRTALGFAGDAALDPTNLLIGPGTTALRGGGNAALEAAARTGGAAGISRELAATAAREFGDPETWSPAVKALVVDSAARGRGALTEQGLKRAGISAVEREKLGIGQMVKTLGTDGPSYGLSGLAQKSEDLKGAAKVWAKSGRSADWARSTFTRKAAGRRVLTQIIHDASQGLDRRSQAILASTTINGSLGTARRWGAETEARIVRDLTDDVGDLDHMGHTVLIGDIEHGVAEGAAPKVAAQFKQIRDDLVEAGVDVGDLGETFVPHQVTDDWYKLAEQGDLDAAQMVEGIDTKRAFQNHRTVQAGDKFLGEVTDGTIVDMNRIALKNKGIKIFNDDLTEILPKYVQQATDSMAKAKQKAMLVDLGLSKELAETEVTRQIAVSPETAAQITKARAALKEARDKEVIALKDGSTVTRGKLGEVRASVQKARADVAHQRRLIETEVQKSGRQLADATTKANIAVDRLHVLEESKAQFTAAAKTARGNYRKRALRELDKVNARIAEARTQITKSKALVDKLDSPIAKNSYQAWQTELEKVSAVGADLATKADELRVAATPIGEGPTPSDLMVKHLNVEIEKHLLKTNGALQGADAAANVFTLAVADAKHTLKALDAADAELDAAWKAATDLPARKTGRAGLREEAADLRQRIATLRQVISTSTDPRVTALAKLDAVAAAQDVAAAHAKHEAVTMEQMIEALGKPEFVTTMERAKVGAGMTAIGETHEMPGWLHDALTANQRVKEMPLAKTFIGKFYNMWKGYAILRPGFQIRNAYSAMYNMYLEAGADSITSAARFSGFYRRMNDKEGLDGAIRWATEKYGAKEASMMNDAWTAVQSTGTGQAHGEFVTAPLKGGTLNPFSRNNKLIRANQHAGEFVEGNIRGAHAYDVMRRGGSFDHAVDTVTKWHFNYTDLNDFDQNAKLVNPFWTFFSRNMALQVQTFTQVPAKLNRSYVNAARNLSYGQEPDTDVPDYFREMGAIRLPGGGGSNHAVNYLAPDLPTVQAPGLMDQLTNPQDTRWMSNLNPLLQIPIQHAAGKQLFSDIPFKGPVKANLISRGIDAVLPGSPMTTQGADGVYADDEAQNVVNNLLPLAGSADRLLPSTASGQEKQLWSWLGFVSGVGVKSNTDRTRKGEQYRKMLEEQAQQDYRKALGY